MFECSQTCTGLLLLSAISCENMMDERSRCETYRSAGELVFVKKSCGFASQNPRIFFMAKRQIPLDAVLHRFR